MAWINFDFVRKACETQEEVEAAHESHRKTLGSRVSTAPRGAEFLTSNEDYQSFNDHGTIRYYLVSNGSEVNCDHPLVQEC
jgi:hypothetical protein